MAPYGSLRLCVPPPDLAPASPRPTRQVPDDLVYSGKYKLTDVDPETGVTLGKLVLSPTRTYAPVVKKLLANAALRKHIHGMVHCSGGAQTKVCTGRGRRGGT